MLGKLFKEEWRNSRNIPFLFVAILLATSLLAGLTFAFPIWESEWVGLPLSAMMLILLYYFAMIVCTVGIMVYLAVRFYKSMYTDEGYLTHTLPTTARQTLLSKILTMSLWQLISVVAILASFIIFGTMVVVFLAPMEELNFADFWEELRQLAQNDFLRGWQGFVASVIAMMLIGCFSSTALLTGAISLGQMVRKHRILGAIGAYFAIQFAIQMITVVCLIPFYVKLFNNPYESMQGVSIFAVYTPIYAVTAVVMLIVGIVMYFINENLVKKHLELE